MRVTVVRNEQGSWPEGATDPLCIMIDGTPPGDVDRVWIVGESPDDDAAIQNERATLDPRERVPQSVVARLLAAGGLGRDDIPAAFRGAVWPRE